ncbi:MAG TPA: DnaB helicase C-terminal domain-containing protein, partial [Gaiellaceae bacterium]
AADPATGPAEAVAFAQAEVLAAADGAAGLRTGRAAVAIDDVLMETFEELDAARAAGRPVGLRTGFGELDALLGAIPPGDYVLLGGRPSQGKTALALNVTLNAARAGVPALVYSLEMQRKKLGRRLLAMEAGVDATAIRMARLTEAQLTQMTAAAQRMIGLPLWVDDLGALSAATLAAATRKHVHRHGPLGLLVIDYVGLMDGDGRAENTEKELKAISKAIKQLAMSLGCVALVLAQLSRKCEERGDKRPVLSDLRDSGSLEQDADAVLFVYRDEYYHKKTKDPGVAEVIVAKQRDGATGTARLRFARELTRFDDLEPAAAPYAAPTDWHDAEETDHAAE